MALENAFSLFEDSRYEELFPNVRLLGNPVDYFIQCNTYEVLVPSQAATEQRLDMFEDAVLKLLEYKPYTKEELADTLCLPKDIISFIKIRLKELGLLEKDEFTVSELGKNYLSGLTSSNKSVVYRQAKLFVIKDTGEILPYVHYGELEFANIKKTSKNFTTIEYGSAGRPSTITGENIWAKSLQGALGGKMLKSNDIKETLYLYNKISSNSTRFAPIEIFSNYAIENTSSEDCLLHVKAAIQEGSADELIVSDGFVANNDFLARYLKKEHPEIISEVKTQAVRVNSQEPDEESNFDFAKANEGRYRSLYQPMYSINSAYEKIMAEESGSSQDEYVEEQYDQKQFLLNCYAVIEHTLYNYLLGSPLGQNRLKLLYRQDTYLNQELILTLSEQLGLEYIRQYDYLFGIVSRSNITKMYNSKTPNMYIVLPLVLIEAFDNKSSLFRVMIEKYPGVIHTINKLHNKCKDLRHKTYADDINVDYVDQIYYFTTLLIECLLPDFIYSGKGDVNTIPSDVKQNQRLLVDVNLAEVFGPMYYYNVMDESLKNEWKLVAPGKTDYPAPYEYVNTLYRILQETIYEQVFYMKKKQLPKEQIVELARNRWGKELERGLTGVHKDYVKDTLGSKSTTLGAQALVYLCFCPDEKLLKLREYKFDEVVSLVTKYREHGNNVALQLDTRDLEELRDKVINVTKVIGGI
ncbi:hypothetical protein [Pseudobutyrivibrio xylanivorans]|uniref:Uncharacterized protein n=1 Tax=Pseudobutyrivibrio xylanivorans TaxID=185007 RepID=A0A5P6VVP3_PSEXY|nr:hypothetical protein [Pseudobutyrivibrio xylanivorans]QFJ55281.1 hypothetical protein FXF36_10605 [Pseudobutyrivibrio xylanivorans]